MAKCDMTKKKAEKKKALHKMVEALIKGDSEEAATHLHDYLTVKTREILVGEAEEGEDEKEEKDEDEKEDDKEEKSEEKDEDEKDEDEDDKEEKVEEGFAQNGHGEGAMSRKVQGQVKFEKGGKKTLRKHGNSAPHLDDDKVDDVKFEGGGKKTLKKHGNSAPHLKDEVKGNFLKK